MLHATPWSTDRGDEDCALERLRSRTSCQQLVWKLGIVLFCSLIRHWGQRGSDATRYWSLLSIYDENKIMIQSVWEDKQRRLASSHHVLLNKSGLAPRAVFIRTSRHARTSYSNKKLNSRTCKGWDVSKVLRGIGLAAGRDGFIFESMKSSDTCTRPGPRRFNSTYTPLCIPFWRNTEHADLPSPEWTDAEPQISNKQD